MKAWKADTYGNLVFKGTAMNFNPECAMAAKYTIAEVEEVRELLHCAVPGEGWMIISDSVLADCACR